MQRLPYVLERHGNHPHRLLKMTSSHCRLSLQALENLRKHLHTQTLHLAKPVFPIKRAWDFFRSRAPTATLVQPQILRSDVPIEEETLHSYNHQHFCPVYPGDSFHTKYEMITKVGFGAHSTVWLARDMEKKPQESNRFVVVKANNCNFIDEDAAKSELNMSKHICQANPLHEGLEFVRTSIDSFTIHGPHGKHVCLVFEAMREPLWLFEGRAGECLVIHTDLTLDNIMVAFEDPSVVEDFVQAQAENPMPRKVMRGRSIYISQDDFGPIRSVRSSAILPKIGDFGLAQYGTNHLGRHPIQTDYYRAPEVILGAGWTYSADIWNLGVLLWNLLEQSNLFRNIHSDTGEYRAQVHLAEMIALLGAPLKELIDREKEGLRWRFRPHLENQRGKLCGSARDFFGGPFFDSEGEFMYKDLIPDSHGLEASVPSLKGNDRVEFLRFIQKMLQWLPEKRSSAEQLLDDRWLQPPRDLEKI